MKLTRLFKLLRSKFGSHLIPVAQPPFIGAIPDPASLQTALTQMAANGQSSAGGVNYNTSAAASLTLTVLGSALQFLSAGAAVTVTLDAAYNIVKSLPQPVAVGQTFGFRIVTAAATTVATPTLLDTAVTLAGTTSIAASTVREYLGTITQLTSTQGMATTTGTTFTSLTQVGSSNLYTVALGTNTLTPTVGQLINLTAITGTLPPGWYPIVKVTSATSFVIAAPINSPAWTATAATVGTSTVAPATYSPLVTITGMFGVATATA